MGLGLGRLYIAALTALPDRASLGIQHWLRTGRWPNIGVPKTFNEKIQHRKLHERDSRMPELADKIEAKRHVAGMLGDNWVTPTIWFGDRLPPLPPRNWPIPFALKSSHGSGHNILIRSEDDLDWPAIERRALAWLSAPYAGYAREWLYGQIKPRLLVEPIIGESDATLPDYKIFVFGGHARVIQVDTGRFTDHRRNFFDPNWRPLPFTVSFPRAKTLPPRPISLAAMIEGAETLGRTFPFVRVDLYEIEGRPRFGELTFYPDSGFANFNPASADIMLGDFWP